MRRKAGERAKRAPSPEWQAFQAHLIDPTQIAYEEIRPVVALHQDIKARAAEVGVAPKTLSRLVAQFFQHGIPGLIPDSRLRADDRRLLPQPVREYILQLQAEYPPFSAREIAGLVEVKFDRTVTHTTVARVVALGPLPKLTRRRFPRYAQLPTTHARRDAILRLHLDGWSPSAIIDYLRAPGTTVYDFLRR